MKRQLLFSALFTISCTSIRAGEVIQIEHVFSSILQLAATSEPRSTNVYVLGYHIPGDGGGGFFQLTNSIGRTNFGSRIYAPKLQKSWERIVTNRSYTLRQFGADPTGILDSRDRLQDLFNACRARQYNAIIDQGDFRIVSTRPIVIGKIPKILGRGGKLWNSLPDGYTNQNNYTTPNQTYSHAAVLDENGKWVPWTSNPMTMPWNGKTEMFHNATDCVIEGLNIDGGWGTSGEEHPPGVRPITGIHDLDTTEEFTLYQLFYNSRNVRFTQCDFVNIPGDAIEVGQGITIDHCRFGEYGDHLFYMGANASDFNFSDNHIMTGLRKIRGTPGQTDYVGITRREALKFRGSSNIVICGNLFIDENRTAQFINLQNQSSQPGEVSSVVISNNIFSGSKFLITTVDRAPGAPIQTIRDLRVRNNILTCSSTAFETSSGAAIDLMLVEGNLVNCQTFVGIMGHPFITNAIKSVSYKQNKVTFLNPVAIGFYLAGNINDLEISENDFFAPTPTSSSSHLIVSGYLASNWGLPINNQPQWIKQVTVRGNTAHNFLSWWSDAGFEIYNASKLYTYVKQSEPEMNYELFAVVKYGGKLYRNLQPTQSRAPDDPRFWQIFDQPETQVIFQNNVRFSSESARSPNNANHLFWRKSSANKQGLIVSESGNVNVTETSDPIGYETGEQSTRLNSESVHRNGTVKK
jgi:hypothetical protein